MHRDPFAALRARLVGNGTEGGGEAAAEARRRGIVDAVGQMHKIGIGIIDRDIFRERAPMGEARLELVRADLLIAGMAFGAMSATGNEWHGHAIANPKAHDTPT